jgi:hypothetical protein
VPIYAFSILLKNVPAFLWAYLSEKICVENSLALLTDAS